MNKGRKEESMSLPSPRRTATVENVATVGNRRTALTTSGKSAATRSRRPVTFASRAQVVRDSLIEDARILHARGLDFGAIAQRLKVSRRTVFRWLS